MLSLLIWSLLLRLQDIGHLCFSLKVRKFLPRRFEVFGPSDDPGLFPIEDNAWLSQHQMEYLVLCG